ncbi:MAG: AMMECR1 domain-containing protein [Pirellulaceae bacterium]
MHELPYLTMDVTLLGPFQRLESRGNNRAAEVQVGKHGLMIQQGDKSGLLLPSVATERGWGAERFLQAVCAQSRFTLSGMGERRYQPDGV